MFSIFTENLSFLTPNSSKMKSWVRLCSSIEDIYLKMSGMNDKNSLLEVIFYAGFVLYIVDSHFESLCVCEREMERE